MRIWIDTNGCDETFHEIKKCGDDKYRVFHADETKCGDAEFKVEEDEQ